MQASLPTPPPPPAPLTLFQREPALATGGAGTGLVIAIVGVLQAYDRVNLEQAAAWQLLGFALVAVLPTVMGWFIRGQVAPTAKVEAMRAAAAAAVLSTPGLVHPAAAPALVAASKRVEAALSFAPRGERRGEL
ncbi:MAG TPA: hypothetical protein VFR37_05460 [Longimicrobium sp.]|nr:hypothetical protein [Longimicrobium sp.]